MNPRLSPFPSACYLFNFRTFAEVLTNGMLTEAKSNVGQFIWIDMSGFLHSKTIEEERVLASKIVESGVWLATGEAFKSEIPGYFRLTFTCEEEDMTLGIVRYAKSLRSAKF